MVATPEILIVSLARESKVPQLIKKAGAIMVIELVFRQGTTGQGIDNKETYLWF